MGSFDFDIILWPALTIFIVCLVVTLKMTLNPAMSIFVASVKAGLFVVYFGFMFDGSYTFLDDWTYLEGGRELFLQDIGITNLVENWEYALMIGRGDHFVYYLYNTYAFRLFGMGYYAPVALNVLVTVAIAYVGASLFVHEFHFHNKSSKWFYLFLLLHPDILTWSNIMNGKDIFVLLLHVLMLLAISLYLRGRRYRVVCLALPVVLILLFLRFYVPLIFSIALTVGIALSSKRSRLYSLIISTVFVALLSSWIGGEGIRYVTSSMQENFVNPVYGFIRALLTPIPFNADADYAFLEIASLLHWMLIPFFILGFLYIWRIKTPFSRVFIAYFLLFVGLYAVYGELQGPRHRVQLDYALAVFQFIGLIVALNMMQLKNAKSPSEGAG